MANYKLVFKKSVAKDLRPIPNKDVARILQRIETLRGNPRPIGSETLSGQERY
ncbi:MAG: type II toxin-antitoxin system mRNA interferase toxin, RelE/StbE family, partial [Proteobacteria bacterium]